MRDRLKYLLDILYEYYDISNYEPLGSASGGHPALGKTSGQTFPMHNVDYETEEDEEVDDYVNSLYGIDDELIDSIGSKTNSTYYRGDPSGRADRGDRTGKNVGGIASLMEEQHTTNITKGISPRLTYRTKTNTKGPAFGTQGSAKYIRNRNHFYTGTQYGTSRAPKSYFDDGVRVWSLSDLSPNSAWKRHNRLKKYINSLEEDNAHFE